MDVRTRKNDTTGQVALFCLLSMVLITAVVAVPQLLTRLGILKNEVPFVPMVILGSWIPNIAAFLVIAFVIREKGGIRRLLGEWTRWRVGLRWYLVALSAVAVSLLAAAVYHLVEPASMPGTVDSATVGGGALDPVNGLTLPLVLAVLLLNLVTGAMGEELGWRGFALPRLQTHWNALVSSVVLGLIWGVWHLPLWFAGLGWEQMSFMLFLWNCLAMSVIYTWICNNTGGNMVIVTLFHMFYNFGFFLISTIWNIPMERGIAYLAVVLTIYAAILILRFGARTLAGPSGRARDGRTGSRGGNPATREAS